MARLCPPPPAGRAPSLCGLLCAALVACGSDPGPTYDRAILEVTVANLPPGASALRLAATLGDRPGLRTEEFTGDLARLHLRLPADARGPLRLRAEVNDGTCVTARGVATIDVPPAPLAALVPATLTLQPASPPLCICGSPGLCWEAPTTTRATLQGAFALGPGRVWASGERGLILRHDGQRWLREVTDSTSAVAAIWGSDEDNLWAAAGPALLRYAPATRTWRRTVNAVAELSALWGSGPRDIWAVGKAGAVYRFDGDRWGGLSVGVSKDLRAVFGTGPTDVLLGGDGVLVTYNGSGFSAAATLGGVTISQIYALGGTRTQVWAVGDNTFGRSGVTWTAAAMRPDDFRSNFAVLGGPTGVLVAGGRGGGRSYFGYVGANLPTTSDAILASRDMNMRALASGGGETLAVGDFGTVARLSAGAWSFTDGNQGERIAGLGGSGPDNVWAIGGTLSHYDGARWTELWRTNPYSLNPGGTTAVYTSGPRDVWVGGYYFGVGGASGGLIHFDGATWTAVPEANRGPIDVLWGSGPTDVYALNSGTGLTLHFDGGAWRPVDVPSLTKARSLWGSGPQDLWAVTEAGDLARYDGRVATKVTLPGRTTPLTRVFGTGPASVVAVGDRQLWRFDGATWTAVDLGLGMADKIIDLAGSGPRDLYALLASGELLHLDGQGVARWNNDLAPAGGLFGLWVAPSGDLWLGGDTGTVLRQRL